MRNPPRRWMIFTALLPALAGCLSLAPDLDPRMGAVVVLPPNDWITPLDAGDKDGGTGPDAGADAGSDAGVDAGPPNAFFELLDELQSAPTSNRQALVDKFVAQKGPAFPYVEEDALSFIVLDSNANKVEMAGDITCWDSKPAALVRVLGTNLWHLSYRLPKDARVEYKYIVDTVWKLDPLNPRQIQGGFGSNSEIPMPAWAHPSAIDYRPGIPHGNIVQHNQFNSVALGNKRDLRVYLPPGYPSQAPYSSFYVHDGQEYLDLAKMQNVLDYLLSQGRIEPLVVVFVPPVDRGPEYVGAKIPQFAQFITQELVPFIDSTYATRVDPLRRGMMGTSNGGFITLRIGREFPNLFRRLGGQSSAIGADGGGLISQYAASAPNGHRLYLSTGTLCDFKQANDSFKSAVSGAGYSYKYRVTNEGHSWGNWRGHLDELLTFLWAP